MPSVFLDVITIPVLDSKKTSTYTNVLDLTELLNHSLIPNLQAKLDLTYLYSIGNSIYGGDVTINLFSINSKTNEIEKLNQIVEKDNNIVIEYINGILKILPKSTSVGEYIINDAIITYGNLEK